MVDGDVRSAGTPGGKGGVGALLQGRHKGGAGGDRAPRDPTSPGGRPVRHGLGPQHADAVGRGRQRPDLHGGGRRRTGVTALDAPAHAAGHRPAQGVGRGQLGTPRVRLEAALDRSPAGHRLPPGLPDPPAGARGDPRARRRNQAAEQLRGDGPPDRGGTAASGPGAGLHRPDRRRVRGHRVTGLLRIVVVVAGRRLAASCRRRNRGTRDPRIDGAADLARPAGQPALRGAVVPHGHGGRHHPGHGERHPHHGYPAAVRCPSDPPGPRVLHLSRGRLPGVAGRQSAGAPRRGDRVGGCERLRQDHSDQGTVRVAAPWGRRRVVAGRRRPRAGRTPGRRPGRPLRQGGASRPGLPSLGDDRGRERGHRHRRPCP